MMGSDDAGLIVLTPVPGMLKLIVSSTESVLAQLIASRSDPEPVSFVFVTIGLHATANSVLGSSHSPQRRRWRAGEGRRRFAGRRGDLLGLERRRLDMKSHLTCAVWEGAARGRRIRARAKQRTAKSGCRRPAVGD